MVFIIIPIFHHFVVSGVGVKNPLVDVTRV